MAWRLQDQVIKGDLDFTQRGKVTGQLWFVGRDQPVTLELTGTPWRDLAGHRLTLVNPNPHGETPGDGFAALQRGVTGDITASRKRRVPDCTDEELTAHLRNHTPFPWYWKNTLYLEWFSQTNGRVVIESAQLQLTIDPVAAWVLDEAEEAAQQAANQDAMAAFFASIADADLSAFEKYLPKEDDIATSSVEAEADAESARMDLLLDRVTARLRDESGMDSAAFDRVLAEERERLRRELGEPEPEPLTPEQEAEHDRWIEEMNDAADEALREMETDPDAFAEDEDHPLQKACFELGIRLRKEAKAAGWLATITSQEHPLQELLDGVAIASAKLAGALSGITRSGEWPPDPLFAGDTLVRLKKARQNLRNAINGIRSALEDEIAPRPWLQAAEYEVTSLLQAVETLIAEVRSSLE